MTEQTTLAVAPEPAEPLTGDAKTMLAMLRRHYLPEGRPDGGVFAPEIGSPCGRRRADLIWMPTTRAGGTGLHGHEIKVSRTDLLVELADPTKAEPWAQYCTRWWLVVPHPSLIAGLDMPAAWGVLAPPSGRRTRTMTVVRPAPDLNPREPAPGIARLAAWQLHNRLDETVQVAQENARLRATVEQQRRELDQMRAEGLGRSSNPQAQAVARILAAIEEKGREHDLWLSKPDEAAIVTAFIDQYATVEAAKAIRARLGHVVKQVERLTDPFGYALEELRKAHRIAGDGAPFDG